MRSNLIGCGSQRLVGKDTFFQVFKEICAQVIPDYNVERISFAEPLREELNEFTIPKYNIDLFNCSPEEKELVRPLMIEHGRIKRCQTKGQYFTNLAGIKIDAIKEIRPKTIFVITDLRYTSKVSGYLKDEFEWVKSRGGIVLNLERYYFVNDREVKFIETDIPDEIKNSKAIAASCDYYLNWQTTNNKELRAAFVRPFVDWFLA